MTAQTVPRVPAHHSRRREFRSAVAYIVRNFNPRPQLRAAAGRRRIAYQKGIFYAKISDLIRASVDKTAGERIRAVEELLRKARELHLKEVALRESVHLDQELGLGLANAALGGLGAGRIVRSRAMEKAAAETAVFLAERGMSVGDAIERVGQVKVRRFKQTVLRSVQFETPEVALVEEVYADLSGHRNARLCGLEAFKEMMVGDPCFFELVQMVSDICIKGWFRVN